MTAISEKRNLYLYGAGFHGARAAAYLKQQISLQAIVDSDPAKQGGEAAGLPVISLEQARQQADESGRRPYFLIAGNHYTGIAATLTAAGFVEEEDFCDFRSYMSRFFWERDGKIHLYRVDLSVTQRCTLACEACNMWMPQFECPKDHDYDELVKNIDAYFQWVDHVMVFNLLGGEPLLFPRLAELVEYIGQHWRQRIGELHIFTNGTLMPSGALLEACKNNRAIIDISDYSGAIPKLKEKTKQVKACLQNAGAAHSFSAGGVGNWVDFGYPRVLIEGKETLQRHFKSCRASFRGLYNRRLYYCHLQASAEQTGQFPGCPNDWFDLETYDEARKPDLLKLERGELPLGYLTFCARCAGCAPANQQLVPAAKQVEKG